MKISKDKNSGGSKPSPQQPKQAPAVPQKIETPASKAKAKGGSANLGGSMNNIAAE
jgi:hypothetical protein